MRQTHVALLSAASATAVTILALSAAVIGQQGPAGTARAGAPVFETSDQCQACHNGLATPRGADASIGIAWRASMMANAARDPYWQAGVRREITQHPTAAAAIEHECSACHMPMMRYEAKAAGRLGGVFAHLPIAAGGTRAHAIAADGVSCTACHQATPEKLGTRESFNAGFVVSAPSASGRSCRIRAVRGDARAGVGHAIGHRVRADAGRAYAVVRPLRHLPHAVHPLTGSRRQCRRRTPGAGAVPGVAPQPLRHGEELPGLPHEDGPGGDAHRQHPAASRGRASASTISAAATSSCRAC